MAITKKDVETIAEKLVSALDEDQKLENSLTNMFTFVDLLWVDTVGELRMPAGEEPKPEVIDSRKTVMLGLVQERFARMLDERDGNGVANDAIETLYRGLAKEQLRVDQFRAFEPTLVEAMQSGPGATFDEFATELALASFCVVTGAGGSQIEAVFSLVAAKGETLEHIEEEGFKDVPYREKRDSDDIGYMPTFYRRAFVRDVLLSLPDEFIVRREGDESVDGFVHRCLWSLQEFGLELDAFFPLHRDGTDYTVDEG